MRTDQTQWSSKGRRQRGATLVEYVLILSVVVVGALGGIRYLTDQGSAEVADQADCVSTRPPPPSCLRASVTTVTTVIPPSTSTTEAPTTTTTTTAPPTTTSTTPPASTTTTTTAAPGFDGTVSWRKWDSTGFYYRGTLWYWIAEGGIDVEDSSGNNVRNADVVVRWEVTDPSGGDSGTVNCRTGSNGRCNLRVPEDTGGWSAYLSADARQITLTIVSIDGQPAPSGTDTLTMDRP